MSPRSASVHEMMVKIDRHNAEVKQRKIAEEERARKRAIADQDPTPFSEEEYIDLYLDSGRPWGEADTPEEAALRQKYRLAMEEKAKRELAKLPPPLKLAHAILERKGITPPPYQPKSVQETPAEEVEEFVLPDNDNQALHAVPSPAQYRRMQVAHVRKDYTDPARQHLAEIHARRAGDSLQ